MNNSNSDNNNFSSNTSNMQTASQPLNNINSASNANSSPGVDIFNATPNQAQPSSQNINDGIKSESNINPQMNNISQTTGINNINPNPVNQAPSQSTINQSSINPGQNINNTPSQPLNNINSASNVNSAPGINRFNATTNQAQPSSQNINDGIKPESNINPQMNNISQTTGINNINPNPVNQAPSQSAINQPQINPSQNINNTLSQPISNSNLINDEELLKAFIGKNYEKITTKPFNFSGFFFTTFYMFYRKMFGYGILVFLIGFIILSFINNFIVTIVLNVLIGLLVNKIYLFYAHRKIAKIKAKNPGKNLNELKNICASKGGTSIGKIFLGLITELFMAVLLVLIAISIGISIAFGQFFNLDNWNITDSSISDSLSGKRTLVENVSVSGHLCFNNKCTVTIDDSNNNSSDYNLNVDNMDLFTKLKDYKDYITLNIYYTQKGDEKTIVNYEIYLKSNNEDITSVKNENELRTKIGLYSEGTYTDTFTLTKIGSLGAGFKDNNQYTYTTYTFVDSKNNEYEMKSINQQLNVVEGNQYTITFEGTKDTFDYEFIIKSIN